MVGGGLILPLTFLKKQNLNPERRKIMSKKIETEMPKIKAVITAPFTALKVGTQYDYSRPSFNRKAHRVQITERWTVTRENKAAKIKGFCFVVAGVSEESRRFHTFDERDTPKDATFTEI